MSKQKKIPLKMVQKLDLRSVKKQPKKKFESLAPWMQNTER